MKKVLVLLFILLILTGCSSSEEDKKTEYIAMKSELLTGTDYVVSEELPLDISVNLDRVNEEEYSYKVLFSNPKEDMYDIEAMVVHNYHNEDLFPTIGLFDDKGELLKKTDKVIELSDIIETNKDLSSMNLELKIYIKYKDKNEETKEIYYKTT